MSVRIARYPAFPVAVALILMACSEAPPIAGKPTPNEGPQKDPLERVTVPIAAQPSGYQLLDQLVWGGLSIDLAPYESDVRREIEEYQARYDAYTAQREVPDAGIEGMIAGAQVRYERRLAAASAATTAPELARAYVAELRPCYEWEGYSDCPEREARFAAEYGAAHLDSPFREYLPLLEAHRWICAAEGYEYEQSAEGFDREKATAGAARSGTSYKSALAAALSSRSRLVQIAAAELSARDRCRL